MKSALKRSSVRAVCFVAVLLLAGCGQPSLPISGEAVDLSVQETVESSSAVRDADPVPSHTAAGETSSPNPTQTPDSLQSSVTKPDASHPSNTLQPSKQPSTSKPSEPQPSASQQLDGKPEKKQNLSSIPEESKPTKEEVGSTATASPEKTPEPSLVPVKAGKPGELKFPELYADVTVRGIKLSDKVNRLNGQKVEMTGFMAPPLTATIHFFVLTKVALNICPFCSSDADWPEDIVVVFMPNGKEISPTEHQVRVTGTLSVGSQTDEETGFVSLIRIIADKAEVLK